MLDVVSPFLRRFVSIYLRLVNLTILKKKKCRRKKKNIIFCWSFNWEKVNDDNYSNFKWNDFFLCLWSMLYVNNENILTSDTFRNVCFHCWSRADTNLINFMLILAYFRFTFTLSVFRLSMSFIHHFSFSAKPKTKKEKKNNGNNRNNFHRWKHL